MQALARVVWFVRALAPVIGSLCLLTSACEDDSTNGGSFSGIDGGGQMPAVDAGADGSSPGADGGADAAAETGAGSVQVDGKYRVGPWVCGQGGSTIDILAFAATLDIEAVYTTIAGSTGQVDVQHSATCTRTTPLTNIDYPSPGTIRTTAANAFTCSATCTPATCKAGTQPVIVDTYSIEGGPSTYTYTRVLGANDLGGVSIQKAAGCQVGDSEVATYVKQ